MINLIQEKKINESSKLLTEYLAFFQQSNYSHHISMFFIFKYISFIFSTIVFFNYTFLFKTTKRINMRKIREV